VPPVYVLSGNTAAGAKPEDPVWEGHTFVGWFTTDETYTYVTGEDGQERLSDDPAENTSLSIGETAGRIVQF
jgi:hypothetical protein